MQRCTETYKRVDRHGVQGEDVVKKKMKGDGGVGGGSDANVKMMLPVSPSTAVGTRGSLGTAGGKMVSSLSNSQCHTGF